MAVSDVMFYVCTIAQSTGFHSRLYNLEKSTFDTTSRKSQTLLPRLAVGPVYHVLDIEESTQNPPQVNYHFMQGRQ